MARMERHYWRHYGRGAFIGPLIGGLVIIWLGVTFYLQQTGAIISDNWWSLFVAGLGAILILQGALRSALTRRPVVGSFFWGATLLVIGLAFYYNTGTVFWSLVVVLGGIALLAYGLFARRPWMPPP